MVPVCFGREFEVHNLSWINLCHQNVFFIYRSGYFAGTLPSSVFFFGPFNAQVLYKFCTQSSSSCSCGESAHPECTALYLSVMDSNPSLRYVDNLWFFLNTCFIFIHLVDIPWTNVYPPFKQMLTSSISKCHRMWLGSSTLRKVMNKLIKTTLLLGHTRCIRPLVSLA